MLIIKTYMNTTLIDEIVIHRIKTGETGTNTYRIIKPEGHENQLIYHQQSLLYKPLLIKALEVIYISRHKSFSR